MKYKRISGDTPLNMTGLQSNCCLDPKEGYSWWHEILGAPLDAPEGISAGAMQRMEWKNHLMKNTMSWYPSQKIILRGES
jgi:hypothetical protein